MKRHDRFRLPIWLAPRAYWGIAVLALLFAGAAAAPVLWWIALAAAATLAAALAVDASTGPPPSSITIDRVNPEAFSLGRTGELRYCVRNASRRGVRLALIEPPVPLLRGDPEELVLALAPVGEGSASRTIVPLERGSASVEHLYAWFENRVGLLRRRVRLRMPAEIRVYPDLSAVERYGALHARNRTIEAGLRKMRLRGSGTEPESVREWTDGDSFRAIEWKATARRGRLMVAQYEVERSQNVVILLDAGRLMTAYAGDRRKFDYAVTAALSLASIASLANDKVGVVAFAAEILRAIAPRASGRSTSRIAQEMYDLQPRFEEADYDGAFAYVRAHVRKRSLVVLFTDMIDPSAQQVVLAQIGTVSRRHLVVCAFMNDAAIDSALSSVPQQTAEAYAVAVALELRDERQKAAATLARLGVQVVDVPASELSTALIDRYLLVKQRGLL